MKIKFPDLPNGTKFTTSDKEGDNIYLKLGRNSLVHLKTQEFYEDKWRYNNLNCYPIEE